MKASLIAVTNGTCTQRPRSNAKRQLNRLRRAAGAHTRNRDRGQSVIREGRLITVGPAAPFSCVVQLRGSESSREGGRVRKRRPGAKSKEERNLLEAEAKVYCWKERRPVSA